MSGSQAVTRVDHDDPRCKAALEAERHLFAHYGLDYQVHFVELNEPNMRVRVLEVGEGPPLLIVPGGSGDAVFFAALMAELKGWRLIAINRPGGGLSDGIDHRQVDVRRLALDTLRTVAGAFGLERVPIVCNSMGGLWSIWYALDSPERVSRMAQVGCPALILDTSAPFFMRLLGVPGINRLIAPRMQPRGVDKALDGLRLLGSSQEDLDRMPVAAAEAAYHFFKLPTYLYTWMTLVSAMATLGGARAKYRLDADELKSIRQPVLFVWGENDTFGNLDVARKATRIIPDARLHEMRTGHLPFVDQPQECGRVIREFLEPEAR